jgi:biotin operon repressor
MISRTQRILLLLANACSPLTSQKIAESIGVSRRTIINDIPHVKDALSQNGAELISKRNIGYYINVTNKSIFDIFIARLSSQSVHISVSSYDKTERLLYISRKLIASSYSVKEDELASDLCLSLSSLRDSLNDVYAFCKSFHLKVKSTSKYGIVIEGSEYQIRMAMTELFENHFHKAVLNQVDQEYARWIWCDYQERQDIRHIFLEVLRKYPWSLRDSMIQRIAMYLVIARNRMAAGLFIQISQEIIFEIKSTSFYNASKNIFFELSKKFSSYQDINESEISFLAIRLLCDIDPASTKIIHSGKEITLFPYQGLVKDGQHVARMFIKHFKIDTDRNDDKGNSLIKSIALGLFPFLVAHKYEMDGCQRFNYKLEKECLDSPLSMYFVFILFEIARRQTHCKFARSDAVYFAALFSSFLFSVDYNLKPLRLIVVNNMGVEFAAQEGNALRKLFPKLIRSIKVCNLYEARDYKKEDYDALIFNNRLFAYNYDFPVSIYGSNNHGIDFGRIHDDILINAYQINGLLPLERCIKFYHGIRITSSADFFQLITIKHGKDEQEIKKNQFILKTQYKLMPIVIKKTGFLFKEVPSQEEEFIDVYMLGRATKWGEGRVTALVYSGLCLFRNVKRHKALERLFTMLACYENSWEELEKNPRETMTNLLRDSLKISKFTSLN